MSSIELQKAFASQARTRGKTQYFPADVARKLVERAREAKIEVLGLDAVRLTDDATQPLMELSIDLSPELASGEDADSWTRALEFLQRNESSDVLFEVVLDP